MGYYESSDIGLEEHFSQQKKALINAQVIVVFV